MENLFVNFKDWYRQMLRYNKRLFYVNNCDMFSRNLYFHYSGVFLFTEIWNAVLIWQICIIKSMISIIFLLNVSLIFWEHTNYWAQTLQRIPSELCENSNQTYVQRKKCDLIWSCQSNKYHYIILLMFCASIQF